MRKTFIGTYRQHDGITVHIRKTSAVPERQYTHAVIPYYTTRIKHLPSDAHGGLTVPVEIPCLPWYGKARFCSSLALARKQLRPGWLLVQVEEQHRTSKEDASA